MFLALSVATVVSTVMPDPSGYEVSPTKQSSVTTVRSAVIYEDQAVGELLNSNIRPPTVLAAKFGEFNSSDTGLARILSLESLSETSDGV
ncbi:hypothetical protein AA0114_g6666 [Alternaria tenuissima]|uniref:Uncharacterized protein n=1 Tax=Alternaria tenuissima TaxID=119927 RepID=A0A4V1WMP1_9PLEO|nr:hypothetical protein AA0114_g6666 [Alternaria tenuissima]